jgi:16S rRNA A1518/A1519 N6-dimethyltransferase RsmA/KsgA/DIM1 with predicted DNA glycosylase/AP lyase activity
MLRDIFSDTENLLILQADVLKTDIKELLADYVKAADASVRCQSALLYYLSDHHEAVGIRLPFESIVVMMQKK